MAHVFVSYSRRDAAFVDRLVAALEGRGVDVWLDRSDITGGAAWEASISEALQDAAHVVVVLSPAALDSDDVARELALAGEYERPIVPVEHQPVSFSPADRSSTQHQIRFRLAGLQRIDFARQDFASAFERLLAALAATPPGGSTPIRLPDRHRRSRRAALLGALAAVLAIAGLFLARRLPSVVPGFRAPSANAAIAGEWFARVVYSWGDTLDERFDLTTDGDTVHGAAGYLLTPEPIQDGRIDGDRLSFQLQRMVRVNDHERPVTYRYQGKLGDGEIRFTMVDDLHRHPIAFTARRSREAAATAAGKRPTGGIDPSLLPVSGGTYPGDTIRRLIDEQMDAIRACYRVVEFDPVDHQSACYALRFDATGRVVEIGTEEGRRSATLDACMERTLRQIAWGPTAGDLRRPTRLCFTASIGAPR